jgi:hypothetical protein
LLAAAVVVVVRRAAAVRAVTLHLSTKHLLHPQYTLLQWARVARVLPPLLLREYQALIVHLAALQAVLLLAAAAAGRQITEMGLTAGLAAAALKTLVLLALRERALRGKVLLVVPLLLILQAAVAAARLLLGLTLVPTLLRARAETA